MSDGAIIYPSPSQSFGTADEEALATAREGLYLLQDNRSEVALVVDREPRKKVIRELSGRVVGRVTVSSFPWVILFFVLFVGFGMTFTYEAPAAVVSDLMIGLRLTNQDYAWLFTAYTVPNVVMPLAAGVILDKFGIRFGVLLFMVLVAMGTYVCAVAAYSHSFLMMVFGRFLIGLGGESSFVAADTVAFVWFSTGAWLSLSISFTAGAARLGEIASFLVLPPISHEYGFEFAYLVTALVTSLSVFMVIILVLLDSYAERRVHVFKMRLDRSSDTLSLRAFFQLPLGVWLCALTLVTYYGCIYPWIDFSSDWIQQQWGYSADEAGRIVSFSGLTSILVAPFLGFFLDRFGKKLFMIVFGNVLLVVGCLLMTFPQVHPIFCVVIMGFAYATVASALWPALSLVVDDDLFGTAYGLSMALANVCNLPIYQVLGYILDHSRGIDYGCYFLAFVGGLGFLVGVLWMVVDRIKYHGICDMSRAARERHFARLHADAIDQAEAAAVAFSNSSSSSSSNEDYQ